MARRGRGGLSGEDRLIARHFRPLARDPGALGLIDDAARLRVPEGHELVLTVDAIVGGVHFFNDDPADVVAGKALRVNLSDLAAKGATPAGFLLTLALPKGTGDAWMTSFSRALGADAEHYGCPLLGGDTVRTPGPIMVSIAAFGTVPKGRMVRRDGANVGDHVVVSGTIGDAALGLALRSNAQTRRVWKLDGRSAERLVARYLVPEPRNALAAAIRGHASGAMDVSDGLVGDLTKLCRASRVAAELDAQRVPLSRAARAALAADSGLIETILTGGDDYEVVATVPPKKLAAFRTAARAAGVPVTPIGRIAAGQGVRVHGPDGKPLAFARGSFSHF